jgi:hypothetical protein
MAIEQDPKRLSRPDIIAYVSLAVGVLSLAVGIISYIRPPDPAHPLRFDFLLQRVSFPLWGTMLGFFATMSASSFFNPGRSMFPPEKPPSSYSVAITCHPSCFWLKT